jgi:hypothetical protein
VRNDSLVAANDAAEEDDRVLFERLMRGYVPQQHTHKLEVDVVQARFAGQNFIHLLQTDNNVQPVMGAVHMVKPAADFSDKHFMLDMNGDINEGHRTLVERSKRGPFRAQRGRSTVMDSSAHVVYRKRAGAFEITVKRGAVAQEFQQLLTKLSMHRMSTSDSLVTIIKGSRRYRLGKLSEINLKYLQEMIEECVLQYGTCGLEITEPHAGTGALYGSGVHKARFKSNARRKRGPAAQR